MAKQPYASARWRDVRRHVLRRDGGICQLRYRGCLGVATAVDHITAIADLQPGDPALLDPANLQAACGPCNSRKRHADARLRAPNIRPPAPSRPPARRRVTRQWDETPLDNPKQEWQT